VVADVLDDRGAAVVGAIGATARYVPCDVTNEDDWTRLMSETIAAFGRLDVLVNNAAVLHLAGIEDTTVADYRRVFEVNELGTFLGIRAAIDPMRADGGSIVNISSIDGLYVTPGTAAYAASKFAVRGLTKTAALELGRYNIRVNAVCPAAGNMEMVVEALPDGFDFRAPRPAGGSRRGGSHRAPLEHRGTMDDVADAVVFFASDESAFVSGADLLVDGALSAGMIIPGQPGT
jgi:3alpha(or 20beta)-hydroxysteroid dehydrogenase